MLIYELLKDGYFLRPNPQNSRQKKYAILMKGKGTSVRYVSYSEVRPLKEVLRKSPKHAGWVLNLKAIRSLRGNTTLKRAYKQVKSKSTGILCAICGRDHGVSPNNKHLYNGFKDGDTGETIGWSCRDAHYDRKVNSVHGGKYTEMPVVL